MAQDTTGALPLRRRVPEPPRGRSRLRWWGPGLLWAMSAVGSGSVLFTPRVGAEYQYSFLWLLWGVCLLMLVVIREAGRFTVVTGRTLLDGFSTLPGPRNWALWVVFLPQLVAAAAGVAGLSALVGSALAAEITGGLVPWSLAVLAVCLSVVLSGGYRAVSRVALVLALVLVAIMVLAAGRVFRPDGDAPAGLVPGFPADTDIGFVLPWVGTILAGSMGIIWFSYWTARRGFGGGTPDSVPTSVADDHGAGSGAGSDFDPRIPRLAAWLRTLSITAGVGVLTGTIIITSFLVLGAELLAPAGVVPSGTDVATDLTRLLSDVWGQVGHWLMLVAIVVTLGGSVLANQDGWSRSFADIALLLGRPDGDAEGSARVRRWSDRLIRWRPNRMGRRQALKLLFAFVVTGLLPAAVILVVRNPVTIMAASGIVATVHTPFIVLATLAVNRRLPAPVRPGTGTAALLGFSGLFYAAFAVLYFAPLP